ncbi:type IX secretion system outer membrane channel protein PorV [Dyadobacter sp. CY261]|uniref:type IX secretion system outer membrane channel protein PorV n=1 Tax=Dyadobacter sp. CY261 TaxID=2907203 RepID=UPI001F2EF4DC|nr:type IX secretion system outer membrane channel protein PorV [Dyadobacter sp. CY261]MCF0071246.1 type IX secretion system outer membrane channel protein PorV [Dyadobacter sp. CY261]
MKAIWLILACILICNATVVCAQTSPRIPDPGAYALSLAPDARAGGMGYTGTATNGDANAMFWNPGKLPDAPRSFGVSATYSPWLPSLIDNAWVGYVSGYKKLNKGQVMGASVHYFSQAQMNSPSPSVFAGRDIAFNAAYAKQLGSHFSMGMTLKYLSSSIGSGVINGVVLKTANVVAGDIGAFYRSQSPDVEGAENMNWTVGVSLTNIGPKLNYGGANDYFLPTTLRLGGGFSYTASGQHKLNVAAEAGKLLVPTPVSGRNVNQKPYLEGIIQSFSDAPGGFKEEMQEVVVAMGAEYWYKEQFGLRGGYRTESIDKGGRKFFTVGAGVKFLEHYGLDFAYLIPQGQNTAMKNMYKIGGSVYF